MCPYPDCRSTPRAPNTHDLACRKSRDEPVCRPRGGELVGRPCQGGGVLRRGHPARPGTFSSGRGHVARAGTGILSPTASTVPGCAALSRRRRLSPTASTVPGRKDAHPAAQQCPRLCSPVPTASTVPGPTGCHPEAASARANQGRATTRARTVTVRTLGLERVTGIEPALSAWEAEVLPLNYTRVAPEDVRPRCVRKSNPDSGRLRKSTCGGASRTTSATPSPTTLANGFPDVFIGVVSA